MQQRGNAAPELDSLAEKLLMVRDRVAAVVGNYQTGLYLYGAGGLGKSHTVMRQLEELGANYRLYNSRMTGKGLFQTLEKAPDAIHVLEDMERLTRDRDGQGVLRSALWAQPGHDRVVTWTTATGGEERFAFRGGVIMIANRPLADLPELRALATRIAVHKLDVADVELVALMRSLACDGYRSGKKAVEPAACAAVAEHVIGECRAAGCPLDLRLYVNGLMDYLQWDQDNARCHWRDLVSARVRQSAAHLRESVAARSKEEQQEIQRDEVRKICALAADPNERVRLWRERTGKSQATFYRRLREVESGVFS
jgi:hypothetical protein